MSQCFFIELHVIGIFEFLSTPTNQVMVVRSTAQHFLLMSVTPQTVTDAPSLERRNRERLGVFVLLCKEKKRRQLTARRRWIVWKIHSH